MGETYLENDKIRVDFSKETGDIASFYDKVEGKYIIQENCKAIDKGNIILSSVKELEDGKENVLHIYEMNGEDSLVNMRLFDKKMQMNIGHNEIKVLSEDGRSLDFMEEKEEN